MYMYYQMMLLFAIFFFVPLIIILTHSNFDLAARERIPRSDPDASPLSIRGGNELNGASGRKQSVTLTSAVYTNLTHSTMT